MCCTMALLVIACGEQPANNVTAACQLRVAWDPYEPYSYSKGGEIPVGYDIDVVTKVADTMGCSLIFTEMAWSDILVAVQNGETDITVGTGYKSDRASWSWYSESYRQEIIGLLVRAGTAEDFPGDSLDQLFRQGLVFGKTIDDTYSKTLAATFSEYGAQVRPRVSEADNIRRLLNETIDGFLVEMNVASSLLTRLDVSSDVAFHPLTFDAGTYRLQMSKKTVTAVRLAQINTAIQQLAATGWLAQTLETYGIQSNSGEK